MAALALQGQMMAQLSYIVDQLKACTMRDTQCAVQHVMQQWLQHSTYLHRRVTQASVLKQLLLLLLLQH